MAGCENVDHSARGEGCGEPASDLADERQLAFNGVDQATPTGTYASASGTGTTATVNVSSATGDLVIDTTRPELLPSCVAMVAHPDDERYQPLFGSTVTTPVFGVEVPVVAHEEDVNLAGKGYMNEGAVSARLGCLGIPSAAEEVMVATTSAGSIAACGASTGTTSAPTSCLSASTNCARRSGSRPKTSTRSIGRTAQMAMA